MFGVSRNFWKEDEKTRFLPIFCSASCHVGEEMGNAYLQSATAVPVSASLQHILSMIMNSQKMPAFKSGLAASLIPVLRSVTPLLFLTYKTVQLTVQPFVPSLSFLTKRFGLRWPSSGDLTLLKLLYCTEYQLLTSHALWCFIICNVLIYQITLWFIFC
jgi:hypothetical protein